MISEMVLVSQSSPNSHTPFTCKEVHFLYARFALPHTHGSSRAQILDWQAEPHLTIKSRASDIMYQWAWTICLFD